MITTDHDFKLAVFNSEGGVAGVFTVPDPDWEPAGEAAWLQALRAGRLTGAESQFNARVAPVWHESLGSPWVAGFRVTPALDDSDQAIGLEIPFKYFKSYAAHAAGVLIERKMLSGAQYHYLVSAEPRAAAETGTLVRPGACARLAPLTLRPASLAEALARSVSMGTSNPRDFRVFVPERVLEEVSEQTTRAGEAEAGAVLLGHLNRDTRTQDVFLEVTAQVPAPHTEGSQTALKFTAASWSAVRASVARRQNNEVWLGWQHSHPQKHWELKCSERCPPEKRTLCPLAGAAFLSDDDVSLHRAIFSRAFCVALLVTVTDGGLRYALFGWRDGMVQQRGFDLLVEWNPGRFLTGAETTAIVGDDCHD